jgi:hypothetical protein
MSKYHSLHFLPVLKQGTEPPTAAELPESPDLTPYAARRAAAKRTFLRQLVDHADEPFVGMQWDVPGLGRILIQMDLVQHTAALVTIGKYAESPDACSLLSTAVLLSGFAEADEAALNQLATTPGFADNPWLAPDAYDPARTAARPLMVQCFVNPDAFTNPHLRSLIEALADAFFDQFGTGAEGDEEAAGDGDAGSDD